MTFCRPARTPPGGLAGRGPLAAAPRSRSAPWSRSIGARPGPAGSACAQGLQRLAGSIGALSTFALSAQGQCPVGGFCD
jgi:hypothetical protein